MRVHALLLLLFLGIASSSSLIAGNTLLLDRYDARRLQIIPADSNTEGYLTIEEDITGSITISHCNAQRVCSPLAAFPSYSHGHKSDFTLLVKEQGKLANRPYLKSGLILGAGVLGALEWSGLYEAMTVKGELPYLMFYMAGLPLTVAGALFLGPPVAAVSTAAYALYLLAHGSSYMMNTLTGYGRVMGNFVTTGVVDMVKGAPSYAMRLIKEHPLQELGVWASFGIASYAAYAYLNMSSTKEINIEKSFGSVIKTSAHMVDLIDAILLKES